MERWGYMGNKQNDKKYRVLSLFSGAGGLDLGFEKAGFEIIFATDIDSSCCETLRLNAGGCLSDKMRVIEGDIRLLDYSFLPKDVDLIIGGPPCQSFSASGRRAGGAAGRLDTRGNLFQAYCRIIEVVRPKAFLFENVRGIMGTNKGDDWKVIQESFKNLGYKLNYRILDALDYGVSQQRERMFMVGHTLDSDFLFPQPLYGPDSIDKIPHITAGEALYDVNNMDEDLDALRLQGGKYAHLLPLVPPGDNYLYFTAKRGHPEPIFAYRSRFSDFLYKANPDMPIKTLIASPGKYTGPFHWDSRSFTIAEYKKLQGFPSEYVFFGARDQIIKQIGNSVCPKIAYYLAIAIKKQVFNENENVQLLDQDAELSFDKRKSQKARKTKQYHDTVAEKNKEVKQNVFKLYSYKELVKPTNYKSNFNTEVKVKKKNVKMLVLADEINTPFVDMELSINISNLDDDIINLKVKVLGNNEYAIHTMWNAVDDWVKKSSNFHSLFEMYGHFTEPHPVFRVKKFICHTNQAIALFAKHCSDFNNCSKYFPREHLTQLFGVTFKTSTFIELVKKLRSYRYDIRCYETNIAIPKDVYMVAYPFSLPNNKQMNFSIRENTEGGLQNMAKNKKTSGEANEDIINSVFKELDIALAAAEQAFYKEERPPIFINGLSSRLVKSLEDISNKAEKASTGFTNIVTSLAIKSYLGDKVDIRYHQVQIQDKTDRPAGFNFRRVSEKVFPWLSGHHFQGAKSGWQTRTFERPKPYLMDYDENIGDIKESFLACYDEVEVNKQNAKQALAYLIFSQVCLRDKRKINIAVPKIEDIILITSLFNKHFFHKYKNSKGASRLPVLALYSIYSVLVDELDRYKSKEAQLKPLQEHSAADSQTGSIGDIEVSDKTGKVIEAIEVKHDIEIDIKIIEDVKLKIMSKPVDRYYVLTTHANCEPNDEVKNEIKQIKELLGCQVIVNGVLPSIKYYLRMLLNPSAIFPYYADLLQSDKAVAHEHRDVWNSIITGQIK